MNTRQLLRVVLLSPFALLVACGTDSPKTILGPTPGSASFDARVVWSEWSPPVHMASPISSSARDLAAKLSPDGLSLYVSSDRAGGFGAIDIWASRRACLECPWGDAINLGANINSAVGDGGVSFSADGLTLYFSSGRSGGYGGEDLWISHRTDASDDLGWGPAVNLGQDVNTPLEEQGTAYFRGRGTSGVRVLYFVRLGDIYAARLSNHGEVLAPATPVAEVNDPIATDNGPTVSTDGREIFFWSNRIGGSGGADLWTATRRRAQDPWSTPQNLGSLFNTPVADLEPGLSRDGQTLFFSAGANARPSLGFQDIWMSTRTRLSNHGDDAAEGDDEGDGG